MTGLPSNLFDGTTLTLNRSNDNPKLARTLIFTTDESFKFMLSGEQAGSQVFTQT